MFKYELLNIALTFLRIAMILVFNIAGLALLFWAAPYLFKFIFWEFY